MLNIAIVEDDTQQAAQLESALKTYGSEYGVLLSVTIFHSALAFLGNYSAKYDIVFMDIMMPMLNGMDASHILREKDEHVMIIFVTSMQQFAVQGYEVGAFDFIVKPIRYPEFKLKFTRALRKLLPEKKSVSIMLKTDAGVIRLSPSQIVYVEVQQHHCLYHTTLGNYRQYQTMKNAESQLEGCGFARCNNFLLVNLAYVTRIEGMNVYVNDTVLQISNPRKKAFWEQFSQFIGGAKE